MLPQASRVPDLAPQAAAAGAHARTSSKSSSTQRHRADLLRGGFARKMVDPCGREALGGRGGEGNGKGRRQHLGAWRGSRRRRPWREGGGASAVAVCEEEHGRWMSRRSEQKIAWARQPLVCGVERAAIGPGWVPSP